MNAAQLRKKKILTDPEIAEIIRELAPLTIVYYEDHYTITDSTGYQTSHLFLNKLLKDTYKPLTDELPPDENIYENKFVNFITSLGKTLIDKIGNIFKVRTIAE